MNNKLDIVDYEIGQVLIRYEWDHILPKKSINPSLWTDDMSDEEDVVYLITLFTIEDAITGDIIDTNTDITRPVAMLTNRKIYAHISSETTPESITENLNSVKDLGELFNFNSKVNVQFKDKVLHNLIVSTWDDDTGTGVADIEFISAY